jgi:glyoxylase-like metal-dependent hydrolase (beta-lactamase superfamily II)
MNLYVINTGNFKLDGGAMFGVVPKSMWENANPPDGNNMCSWAMRCLLIESEGRLMLIDNGMGDKQSEKFFSYYYLHGNDSLSSSLNKFGFHEDDITDMFLTHLHFDHCGGSIKKNGDQLALTFKNAKYWSQEDHWQWAIEPNSREKASFMKENFIPIQEQGHLNFIGLDNLDLSGIEVLTVDGHTDKMMVPKINYKGKTIVFCADLFPSIHHIPIAWVMSYDVRPLLTMKEKQRFLNEAVDNQYILFFEHDPVNECCTLKRTERGIKPDEIFPLREIL